MKVRYVGVTAGWVPDTPAWQPGETRELNDEAARRLVQHNPFFEIVPATTAKRAGSGKEAVSRSTNN